MVSGAFGITTDFHTFTSSLSNCGKRWVWVALFCERTPMANTSRTAIAARRGDEILMFPPTSSFGMERGKDASPESQMRYQACGTAGSASLRSVEEHFQE
jgi:hypothetical protein